MDGCKSGRVPLFWQWTQLELEVLNTYLGTPYLTFCGSDDISTPHTTVNVAKRNLPNSTTMMRRSPSLNFITSRRTIVLETHLLSFDDYAWK